MQYAVKLYFRFNLNHRDIKDLLAEEPTTRIRRYFFLDEVFVKIQGKQLYLWRAIDQDGEVVDVLLQARRDGKAVKRFSTC